MKDAAAAKKAAEAEELTAPPAAVVADVGAGASANASAKLAAAVKASTKPAARAPRRSRADAGSDAAATREKRKHEKIMQELPPAKLRALEALGEPLPAPCPKCARVAPARLFPSSPPRAAPVES